MEYGKLIDSKLEYSGGFSDDMDKEILSQGYKHLFKDAIPILIDLQGIKERYEELEDKIIIHYDIVEHTPTKVHTKISFLKKSLAEWDYKVSKNNEYRDAGLPLPYDPTEIHQRNQPLRDEINELENILMNL